jgi:predicted RNase H-like HicB family nuclease
VIARAALCSLLHLRPCQNRKHVELAIGVQIEELADGLFLATSDELPGLLAQGRTVAETLEIVRDVARTLVEDRIKRAMEPTNCSLLQTATIKVSLCRLRLRCRDS